MKRENSKHHYVVIILISVSLPLFTWYSSVTYAFNRSDLVEVKDAEESKTVFAFLREVIGEPNTSEGSSWYAGTWDSTLYLHAEHPKTIAIRMELLDKDTHLPVKDVNVSLEGGYLEARTSQIISDAQNYSGRDVFVDPEKQEPQWREFRLDAISDSRGIVVFSLNWQKEYPWDSKADDERIMHFDDIEKVERLEIRHLSYKYVEAPVDFKHIVDLKQYEDTSQYNDSKVQKFRALWQNEVKRKDVKLFVLNLEKNFPDFNNKSSQQAEFFEKISEKDYGTVYVDVNNLPNIEDNAKCGPYFVYDMGEILVERAIQQIDVGVYGSTLTKDADDSNEPGYSQQSRSSEKAAELSQLSDEDIDLQEHPARQYPLDKFPEPTDTLIKENMTVETQQPAASSSKPIMSLNSANDKTIDIGDGVTLEFVLIPAGEFNMGSPATEKDRGTDEGPIHKVRISKSFYMGKYEVTQDLYSAVMGSNPSRFKKGTRPVEQVSWEDATAFCKKLSEKYGGSYRLPTEAEWEFACRANTQSRFYYGEDPEYIQLAQYAWYSKNSGATTHPVGSTKPNSFGLYDMHGNVWEWCSDWYAEDYYSQSPDVDPQGPLSGSKRVLRGGGWFLSARCCHSAIRGAGKPSGRSNRGGFRVVRELD